MAASSDPQKVKLLCSFGGKILPRPSDGALRYAGGHTRILSLRRSSTLSDLYAKISHISNAPIAAVKYQLPDEDLDALISISSQEDLDNMFEEFDRICEIATDGSSRMRIFLLSPSDLVDPNPNEAVDTGQSYIDAVNGIGIKRNNSLVSASSNEGISSPSLLSPTAAAVASMNHQDSGRVLGFFGDETTLVSGRIETQQVQFLNPSVNVVKFSPALPYVHPIYINAGNLKPNQGRVEPLMVGGDQLGNTGTGSNVKPNQGKVEGSVCLEENSSRADHNCSNSGGGGNTYNKGFHHNHLQPLSQLPPLHPALVQNLPNSYVPPMRPIPQHTLRLEDCQLCQKSLPHAHSDTLINEHPSGNGNGSGTSVVLEQRAVLQSHHSEDPMRLQASLRVENPVEPRVENERIVHTNTEVLDHSKVLHPPTTGMTGEPVRTQAAVRAVDAESESKVETLPNGDQFGVYGVTQEVSHPLEKERQVHQNVETLDQAQVFHPHRAVPGALAESVMEPKVDKMVPSAQFGAYGFTQIPPIPRPHDNERLPVNPHVSIVMGFPSDTNASYGMFTHPSQWRPTDSFLPITHNMVPPSYLVKQDLGTKQFVSDVSSVKNGNFHVTEPPSRVSVPEISHDYARPIDGMIEGLHVSTFESSGITEHYRPAPAVNLGVPALKPENSTLIAESSHAPSVVTDHQRPAPAVNPGVPMLKPENSIPSIENNHAIRPQAGGNAVFLGNGGIKSGIATEGNASKSMNQLPPSTSDLKPEHPSVASDNNQAFRVQVGRNPYLGNAFIPSGFYPDGNSVGPINQLLPPSSVMMANHGQLFPYSQEMRQQEAPNERLLVMPSYSCGINPPFNNNGVNMLNNVPASPRNKVPIQYANSNVSNVNVEQFQRTSPPESLFCNQDPQKIPGNMQVMPPMPNKVPGKELIAPLPSKEFVAPKELPSENHVVNNKGSDVAVLLEEGGFHHLQNTTNKDVCMEPVLFTQGEEHNKQEVQGLAEQVVTSVLLPSVPPAAIFFPHERKETDLLSTKTSGLGASNVISQAAVAALGDHKIEGGMTKQADKMNFGFPVTDDIGRLQIIKNGDLEELRELGSGTFGTVFHGKWRGSDVAIKRINDRCFAAKPSEEERMRADFWNEACMLADLHHPNVVAFYGVVLDGPGGSFATVTEFMVNGSLRRALQKNDKILDKRKRLLIAMDVAFGMEYLHGKNLIHFDLKSDNLLVNLRDPQRPICKVADLGLSKVKCQTLISGGVQGTLPWMAPELLNGGSNLVSEKVDVFSFGIVMWELITGEEPYADLHYGAIIGGIVSNTLRPPVPESCDPEWKSLMEQCWSAEPSERPSFTEIASRLRSMAASLPQKA